MSDILIRGIDMPKSCPCELLGIGYDLYCSFAGGIPARVKEYYECCQNDMRPSWCPLVPVQPHGRLIDANALKEKHHWTDDYYETEYVEVEDIDAAPTIIPAEPFNNLSKPCKDDDDIPICTKASPASLGIYKKAEEGE